MAGNTSTSPILESLTNVLDLLPGAMLLLDLRGDILHGNHAAVRMLGIEDARPSFYDLVADSESLQRSLRDARRSTGSLPFSFILLGQDCSVGAIAKPVMTEPGKPPTHILVTCQSHDDAGYKMRMLNRELDRDSDD